MNALGPVIFDLDDTLMPEEPAVQAAFAAACEFAFPAMPSKAAALNKAVRVRARAAWRSSPYGEYCRRIGFSSWEGLWGDVGDAGLHHMFFRSWQPVYRAEAWRMALQDAGVLDAALADRVAAAFSRETRARLLPFAGALDVLREIRRIRPVALLTNGESSIQREKVRAAGFEGMFDAVVVSGDLGIGKPSEEPFRAVLARLGATAADSVMVGNSVRSDVLGAQRIGMRAILVGDGDATAVLATPDARASCVADVPAALTQLR